MRLPRAIFQPQFVFLSFHRGCLKVNANKIESNIVIFSARIDEIGSSATLKLVAQVLSRIHFVNRKKKLQAIVALFN